MFAADVSEDPAVNWTVVGMSDEDIRIPVLGHDYDEIKVLPSCTEIGYTVYTCKRDDCDHTYSEPIAATGHDFEFVAEVPAKCKLDGTKAYNKCKVCNKKFAADADPMNLEIVEVADADLVIPGLEHVEKVVDKVFPTYDAAGNEAGVKCGVCGAPISGAATLDELEEAVKFHYVVKGVNGADKGVNSGYVKVEIYFDVLASANDKEEYNSDVLANIYALDYKFDYSYFLYDAQGNAQNVFSLTDVTVAPGLFAAAAFTDYEKANDQGFVAISQDMVNGSKVFRGENNLFATLTFQVNDEAVADTYIFNGEVTKVMHTDGVEAIAVEYVTNGDAEFDVIKLGDANGDTKFDAADTHALMTYFNDEEAAYNTVYDMDKDGDVDFVDFGLLRNAIVGNDDYLEIEVDPNAKTDAEV
jgi:hypothetical protein